MKLKHGVITTGVCPQIWYALGVADQIFRRHNCTLIVTSLMDGTHMRQSKHGSGEATDLRTRDLTIEVGNILFRELKSFLDPLGFDTVDERTRPGAPHFHIEWDPKPGEEWLTSVQ